MGSKSALCAGAVCLALAAPACQSGGPGPAPELEKASDDQKAFYAMGVMLARNMSLKRWKLSDEELRFVIAGLNDEAQDKKLRVELEKVGPALSALERQRMSQAASAEKEKGRAFAEKEAGEQGAVRTASGLVYRSLKDGDGPSPSATDGVSVHYRGSLPDGTEFDSSYKRGQPIRFSLGGVIACWGEGVQRMKVGGKARLVCPPEIAYGDQGRPPVIPGGATLVFEVELLGIAPPPGAPGGK